MCREERLQRMIIASLSFTLPFCQLWTQAIYSVCSGIRTCYAYVSVWIRQFTVQIPRKVQKHSTTKHSHPSQQSFFGRHLAVWQWNLNKMLRIRCLVSFGSKIVYFWQTQLQHWLIRTIASKSAACFRFHHNWKRETESCAFLLWICHKRHWQQWWLSPFIA